MGPGASKHYLRVTVFEVGKLLVGLSAHRKRGGIAGAWVFSSNQSTQLHDDVLSLYLPFFVGHTVGPSDRLKLSICSVSGVRQPLDSRGEDDGGGEIGALEISCACETLHCVGRESTWSASTRSNGKFRSEKYLIIFLIKAYYFNRIKN